MSIEIGQVLWLRIRFNNSGTISKTKHPYIIIGVDDVLNYIEVAQLDSLEGKEYKGAFRSNHVIFDRDPKEAVISKDCFAQLDNTFQIEYFDGLVRYRSVEEKLSGEKLKTLIAKYRYYHEMNDIDENKEVYMAQDEIIELND